MKNKSLTKKISLLTLSLLSAGSLFGKTLAGDFKTEADLTSGLVAWYTFDGNASDMSGNGLDGTVYGAIPTKNRHGVMNSAYEFDGHDDYIRINHSADLNTLPLSISVWFNSGGNPLETGIVSKYSSGHWNGWQIMEQDGNIVPWYLRSLNPKNVIIGRYGENKVFETKFEKNNWNHAVSVFSKDGGFLYLNGELMDQKDWTGSAGQVTTSQHLDIGLYKQTSGRGFFSGLIDDIRIYDRALSDDEVALLYKHESNDPSDDRDTPPPPPVTGPGTPPDPDYKDTIAELKRLLAEKDKQLAHCEKEMDAKNKEIGELTSENAKLQGEVKSLNGKVTGLEKQVATLKSDNEGLKGQIQNLREDNQNLNYELTTTTEHLEEAIKVAETPFINGWVYDPARGWIFTDAEHFPLVYTHNDQSWNYYELGSSDPRYFYNYSTQEWVAWDAKPSQAEQLVAANNNL